jgi:hypothetical protein
MQGCLQGRVKEWVLNIFLYCFSDSRDGCLRGKLPTCVVKITEFHQYLNEARHRMLLMFSDSDYSVQLQYSSGVYYKMDILTASLLNSTAN